MKGSAARRPRSAEPAAKEERERDKRAEVVPLREAERSVLPWALDTVEGEVARGGPQPEREGVPPLEVPRRLRPHIHPKTKRGRIVDLYRTGTRGISEIAAAVGARPSYVAQVLSREGLIHGYFDLYTSTAQELNVYSHAFRGVLSFKNVAAAEASVRRINELYQEFHRQGDRAGQHQAMVVALTGMNRARWCGKTEEAQVFRKWLMSH